MSTAEMCCAWAVSSLVGFAIGYYGSRISRRHKAVSASDGVRLVLQLASMPRPKCAPLGCMHENAIDVGDFARWCPECGALRAVHREARIFCDWRWPDRPPEPLR